MLTRFARLLQEAGATAPATVTHAQVAELLTGYAPGSKGTLFNLLNRFMKASTTPNPLDGYKRPMRQTYRARPVADQLISEALNTASSRDALLIELMSFCGLRASETASLRFDQIETATGTKLLRITGKGDKTRRVPLPRTIAQKIALEDHERIFLFPGYQSDHLRSASVSKIIRQTFPAGVTAHMLRHRFATRVYSQTGDLRAVQELLGHASLATTETYLGVDQEAVWQAARAAHDLIA
ncbi:tyrosine-type recombinase/integrase [Nesterenkonia populi]|uniref:tyrosine-type recombinase/integrase n=1 Tax=Nesterenkonia populi TaxID=1591087 RepID=UPI001478CDAE|nr:tyrosine-type recombinase/integrase [Nesterenkonia populi]